MTKQRTIVVIAAAVFVGILAAGCSSNAPEKPAAQIQADAQKGAADQAKMYQQKMGQQGQPR